VLVGGCGGGAMTEIIYLYCSDLRVVDGEVRPEGCIFEPCSAISLNCKDIRAKFGYTTLYGIALLKSDTNPEAKKVTSELSEQQVINYKYFHEFFRY